MLQHITLRHPPVVQPILDLLSKQVLLLHAQLCPRVLSHTRADDGSGRLATLLPHPGQLPKTSSSIPAHSAVVGFRCDIAVVLGGDQHMPLGTHGWFFRGCRGCGKGSRHSPVMAGYHNCQYVCIVNPTTFTNEVMPNSHIRFDRRHVDEYKQARGLLLQPPCIVQPHHPQRDAARNFQWTSVYRDSTSNFRDTCRCISATRLRVTRLCDEHVLTSAFTRRQWPPSKAHTST